MSKVTRSECPECFEVHVPPERCPILHEHVGLGLQSGTTWLDDDDFGSESFYEQAKEIAALAKTQAINCFVKPEQVQRQGLLPAWKRAAEVDAIISVKLSELVLHRILYGK